MVRVKNRYILVQIRCNERADDEPVAIRSYDIYKYLMDQLGRYYGEFGSGSILFLRVAYFNEKTHLCIIQTMHGPHRFVTSVLPLLNLAGSEPARYRTLYVGATLKQCHKFIVKYQQRYINKTIGDYRGEIQKQKMIEDVTKIKNL